MFLAILHFSKVLPLIKTRVGTGPPVLAERHILRSFSCELFGSNLRLDKDEIFTNQKVYFMPIKCICRLFLVKHFLNAFFCAVKCAKNSWFCQFFFIHLLFCFTCIFYCISSIRPLFIDHKYFWIFGFAPSKPKIYSASGLLLF